VSKGKYNCSVCERDHGDRGCTNIACIVGYHNCASMSHGDVEDAPDPLEADRNKGFQLGQVVEKEDQAKIWRQRSGEAFAAGKDAEANLYRKLAVESEKDAKEARGEYMQKHNPAFAR